VPRSTVRALRRSIAGDHATRSWRRRDRFADAIGRRGFTDHIHTRRGPVPGAGAPPGGSTTAVPGLPFLDREAKWSPDRSRGPVSETTSCRLSEPRQARRPRPARRSTRCPTAMGCPAPRCGCLPHLDHQDGTGSARRADGPRSRGARRLHGPWAGAAAVARVRRSQHGHPVPPPAPARSPRAPAARSTTASAR